MPDGLVRKYLKSWVFHIHTPHSLGWWKKHNMGQHMKEATMEKNYRFDERIKKEFFVFQMCNHVIATTDPQFDLLTEKYDVLQRRISVIPPGYGREPLFSC
jgi:mannosylfructose-phosphate synthase